MSLFGGQPQQSGGLFGSATANKPSPFGGFGSSTTGTQQSTGGGLFGSPQTQQSATGGGLFGSNATQPQQQQQQQQTGGLFGSATQTQPQAGGGLFGSSTQQKPQTGGLFGGALGQTQQPQQTTGGGGLFGSTLGQQKPQGSSLFGGLGQQQQQQAPQQGGGLFGGLGATTQQQQQLQQQSLFGGSVLGGQQQPQLGQTTTQPPGSSLWSPGRAVTGVHRTVPMQIEIVKNKWDTGSRASPFRTYLYNHVGDQAPFYQPTAEDDETKWEEALRERPDSGYVPVLVRGFWELGKRAQRQKDFLTMAQTRLHEINNCLTDLLSRHDLKISVKIADCRRKHLVLSKRCLALAAKTQVLRNRGYAMDEAEEELKKKLAQLERSVFDPSLNGRAEEIWARMLAIREHSKRLQAEMEKAGATAAQGEEELDEDTMKTAKKILDDYHAQITHLQKELESVKKDFEESQKLQGPADH
ncbi:hypothetical protein CNMCM5793_002985 [Aspergillus hiratsukae]|uniref:Nucleoporin Nup54 alpha-helical domain-containing protein n=1 Tax=Aspergillus hiratsukae TaxID=1194566 RepID=A0A8H6UJG3_9EURO|nr:hypothetical protein CNMCM5793_002985 [Aspergillus hiratsukae]KAF7155275.1 hypothetical protein CNMCM6106_002730 [Aspergillus hiratsukae]